MPYCSILECKNDSTRKNLKNGGVSYHRFPKDASVKEKWIDATGRFDWMPTKSSTICSVHFLEEDFLISDKGYRYMKPTALPSMKIVKFFNQLLNIDVATASSPKKQSDTESNSPPKKKGRLHKDCVDTHKIKQYRIQKRDDDNSVQFHSADSSVQFEGETVKNTVVTDDSNCTTPRKRKLKAQLRFYEDKIVKQALQIKRLQSKNRRLKNKIINIAEVILRLEEKFAMAKEN